MCLIIACHFCQYYDNEWAWRLNVGVQIFFLLSGFLYGGKRIDEPIGWISNQFGKILQPYFLFLFFALFLYGLFSPNLLSVTGVVKSIFSVGTIKGIGHLWFVGYILFCYLLTPYLSAIAQYIENKSAYRAFLLVLLVCLLFTIVSILAPYHYRPGRVLCYVLGYFLSVFYWRYGNKVMLGSLLTSVISFLLIKLGYTFLQGILPSVAAQLSVITTDFSHLFAGTALTILLIYVFKSLKGNSFLRLSDKYSYSIYLVHQLFILSPFALMSISKHVYVNIILVLVAIITSGYLLKLASDGVSKLLKK